MTLMFLWKIDQPHLIIFLAGQFFKINTVGVSSGILYFVTDGKFEFRSMLDALLHFSSGMQMETEK